MEDGGGQDEFSFGNSEFRILIGDLGGFQCKSEFHELGLRGEIRAGVASS